MTMTKEELQVLINESIDAYRNKNRYEHLEDVPDWARPAVEKLVTGGIIQGDGNALNLSYDLCRILVILDRLGIL